MASPNPHLQPNNDRRFRSSFRETAIHYVVTYINSDGEKLHQYIYMDSKNWKWYYTTIANGAVKIDTGMFKL